MLTLFKKKRDGFTLIEVMVVLIILGVLAAISVPVYSNYVRKAKINEAVSNAGAYATAIRIYKMEKGSWPQDKKDVGEPYTIDGKDIFGVNVEEYFFEIAWDRAINIEDPFEITLTSTGEFGVSGETLIYTIDAGTYQGTWTGTLIDTYASYLVH